MESKALKNFLENNGFAITKVIHVNDKIPLSYCVPSNKVEIDQNNHTCLMPDMLFNRALSKSESWREIEALANCALHLVPEAKAG